MTKEAQPSSRWAGLTLNALLSLTGLGLVYLFVYLRPAEYIQFQAEDSWAEYATSVSWALASLFFLSAFFRKEGFWSRSGLLILAFASFFVAMEEISWGQRILGISLPKFFGTNNYQSELNFHNFADPQSYYHLIGMIIVLCVVVTPLAARWIPRLAALLRRLGVPLVPLHLWPLFAVPVYILDYSGRFLPIPGATEFMELTLGTAMAVFSLELAIRRPRSLLTALSVIALIGSLTTPVFLAFHRPIKARNELNKFAVRYFPQRLPRQAMLVFDYLDRNPHLRTNKTLVHQGVFCLRAGEKGRGIDLLEAAASKLKAKTPSNPDDLRLAAFAFHALGREEAAGQLLAEAVRRDRETLAGAESPEVKAWALASLSMTYAARGSQRQTKEASASIDDLPLTRRDRRKVTRWLSNEREDHREIEMTLAQSPGR